MYCTRDFAEKKPYYIHKSKVILLSTKIKPGIALTGATGFLGSHLMASLLKSGYKIIVLGRASKEETLQERISKLLGWFGIKELASQLMLVEIDFLEPMLGIPEANYNKLCEVTGQIIHCASDTSFAERKRETVFKSNVKSLAGILEFAKNAGINSFHYISTAFVAGANVTFCKESISSLTGFLNVYEESKAQAEKIITSYCKKHSIPLTIIRPSIVYGDSHTGRSLKFNALYFPLKSLKFVRDIYLNDIKNNSGIKSSQYGIFIDDEGYLRLPLRIYLPKEGALNLIPVDYFVNAAMKIITKSSSGGIFHLTNPAYTKLETITGYNEQLMKMKGVEIIYGKSTENEIRNPAEELFDRFIEPYLAYLSDNRIFDRVNTDEVTGNLYPPEFTYEIFKNCMEYGIEVKWGELIFAEEYVNS
jgi:nucleoside-diphosphate-sugar epimerase